MREELDPSGCLLPVEILVGCVIAVFGKAETEKYYRYLQVFLHRHHGTDGSAFAYKSGNSPAFPLSR